MVEKVAEDYPWEEQDLCHILQADCAGRDALALAARYERSARRAWRCWGLGRHRHLLSLHVQVRIPALEDTGQFPVERPHSRL